MKAGYKVLTGLAVTAVSTWLFYLAFVQALAPTLPVIDAPSVPQPVQAQVPADAAPSDASPRILVTATAKATEDGTVVGLAAKFAMCEPTPSTAPLKIRLVTSAQDSPDLTMHKSLCVEVQAGQSVESVRGLTGEWAGETTADLPEFEGEVKQWAYWDRDGLRAYITLAALSHCETPEGGCSSAVGLSATTDAKAFGITVNLAEDGAVPLEWAPEALP